MTREVLTVTQLRKSYDKKPAVEDISFAVEHGEKFVFVGPNGAGKTTTISILATLLRQDSGEVRYGDLLLGRDNDAIRGKIGVVFQHHTLDDDLTVRENLASRGALYQVGKAQLGKRVDNAIALLDMDGFENQRYGTLSGGQKRRTDIARGLLQNPEVLFLDEPTTGLDPQTRRVVWEIINSVRARLGMTVFLTTHYMEETEDADRVVIIDHGKIVAQGKPAELKRQYAPNILRLYSDNPQAVIDRLQSLGQAPANLKGVLQLKVGSSFEALDLVENLRDSINNFEIVNGSMDDVFIAITGRDLRE